MKKIVPLLGLLILGPSVWAADYGWLQEGHPRKTIASQIPVPVGYERVRVKTGSFQEWLRLLPLKSKASPVYLYDGRKKHNQDAHYAVVEIDVGPRDIQQCADAVIRLRAEYLWDRQRYEDIHFNFTSGDTSFYLNWRQGIRPRVQGNRVSWAQTASPDSGYASFRDYVHTTCIYAGSYSLAQELKKISDPIDLQIGDVFIRGGFPGHAVLVVDIAVHPETGHKAFLLLQSYMPAQDMHILQNPGDDFPDSPWYLLDASGNVLYTPEWSFKWNELKRFYGE
ncbi:hypothetical protein GF406_10260 [candidate division KSB1 bacterium]|nr:hypothetical protein [candidate division KSB1 bacterium]